ncbi:At-rich interactive domain-containing protein [Thalictrum thalictroides]|uniref:At-rich interactive domain-containing protein n=1 Tax=Thalictrum thalictroides TaxID=46969 RepID=A0A7J6VCJ1_THATH|nr:At-rich interactive domain-containing protein [Thalictrum thalictroides]
MVSVHGPQKNTCNLLAVLCQQVTEYNGKYPSPQLVSTGHLEVQTLISPTIDEFKQALESLRPNILYLQGNRLQNEEEIGSLIWGGVDLSSTESICGLFGSVLPDTIYLELPNGEKLAEALHLKGIPYVIYWTNAFSCYAACHFRHAMLSVIQSSRCHTWDAFQLAHASFRLYCVRNSYVLPSKSYNISGKLGPHLLGDPPKISICTLEKNVDEEEDEESSGSGPSINIYDDDVSMKFLVCGITCTLDACLLGSLEDGLNALLNIEIRGSKLRNRVSYVLPSKSYNISGKLGPHLLGDPPKISICTLEKNVDEEEDEESSGSGPSINIYDDDVSMKFLVCGITCTLDACLLGSLEDGLNALLNIEIRGSKLRNRVSAPPPPLQPGAFSRGVVTMRCDMSTSSSSHISLLVTGSAQTCFDDQLLETHIKNALVGKSQVVHAVPISDESNKSLYAPRTSVSIACGATVYEVCMKVPTWASQVLRQLASENSYRSFVALGLASIQGFTVASFDKDDTERLLFFCTRSGGDLLQNAIPDSPPSWLRPPFPSRKRSVPCSEAEPDVHSVVVEGKTGGAEICQNHRSGNGSLDFADTPFVPIRKKLKVAAMRPIRHIYHNKMLPLPVISEANGYSGSQPKANLYPISAPKHKHVGSATVTQRKSLSTSYQSQQIISLNPLPLKKHGCGRCPIQICSEEEFLRDVMQFLILRGHTRLVPQGGLADFPDAILNTKRLDLYNLYREVVSRGGFHVGNGINWKGQVFSKMRNHTVTNKMTGVGNTLKRHYETYLLEYELAHDDVDGECCLLCHSSAAGDWVNCGICGEWAHFGCDRRQGLGAFKDYAKTDGLEYICPHCSITSFSRKPTKYANGYPQASNGLRSV